MGLVAAAVIGYAVYTLITLEPARSEPVNAAEDEVGRRPPTRAERAGPRGVKSAPVTIPGDARARPGPAPRPEPSIPLPEARNQFEEFLGELDRLDTDGTTLSNEQWVQYYKRGHEALQPILQGLDWQDPEQAKELQKANEDLRKKLWKLQPQAAAAAQ